MDSEFSFFYPVIELDQIAFNDDGSTYKHKVDSFGEGHIVYQGVLMCGESRERILNRVHAKRKSLVKVRKEGIGLCEKCQTKYKLNGMSGWRKWQEGQAIKDENIMRIR